MLQTSIPPRSPALFWAARHAPSHGNVDYEGRFQDTSNSHNGPRILSVLPTLQVAAAAAYTEPSMHRPF